MLTTYQTIVLYLNLSNKPVEVFDFRLNKETIKKLKKHGYTVSIRKVMEKQERAYQSIVYRTNA